MTKRSRRPIRVVSAVELAAVIGGSDSRNIEFEMIKFEIQKLAQVQA